MLFPVKAALWVHQPHNSAEFWELEVSSGSSSPDDLVILKKQLVEIINLQHSHFEMNPITSVQSGTNIIPALIFIPSGYDYNSYCYNYLKGVYRQVGSQSFLPGNMRQD